MSTPATKVIFGDFSHYEPNIDFAAMKAAGISIAVTKATQGTKSTDALFQQYWAAMKAAKLYRFAYLFLMPNEAGGDVGHFEDVTHLRRGDGQPIVDAEQAGLTASTVSAAMADLEAKGFEPILYCSLSYYHDVLNSPIRWPLWIAAYRDTQPKLPAGAQWFAWQNTDHGHCTGVPQPCDMNVFLGGDIKKFLIP